MAESDVWRCSRCGWEYPNKHPNAKHRRNHKKKCGKPVKAEAVGAAAGAGVEAAAPGGSSSDDALSDDGQQEEQGHVAIASSNGANTHIEAPGTATGGDEEQDRRKIGDSQANVGLLEAGDEGKARQHQNGGGSESPDEIQEDGRIGASAVNDDPAELQLKEPDLVASAASEAVEQRSSPRSKLVEDKGDPALDSQEVGELWELLLDAEHVSTAGSNGGMRAPHSADPHKKAPGTVTAGEGTAGDEGKVFVERGQKAFAGAAAEEQSPAIASKLLEEKGDQSQRDAEKEQNQEVRELWEQLLEADLSTKNNINNQIGGLDANPVAPVGAPFEAQIQPGYLQQSVSLVPGAASLDGGVDANGTNPFLGDRGRQQIEQAPSSKETWKAFPTDDDDNNGSNAVINPFVGTEGFRASKVDESDIKPHVALQALFENDVKRAQGNAVDAETEAWIKSSNNNSRKKPRSRWSSFICCGSQP